MSGPEVTGVETGMSTARVCSMVAMPERTWRLDGCRDYRSKYKHPFHVSPTANKDDAVDAVELALVSFAAMFGHRLVVMIVRSTNRPGSCCQSSRSSPTTADHSGPSRLRSSSPPILSWRMSVVSAHPGRTDHANAAAGRSTMGGRSSTRSTTRSRWPSTPRNTGSSATRSVLMRPSPGTGPRREVHRGFVDPHHPDISNH